MTVPTKTPEAAVRGPACGWWHLTPKVTFQDTLACLLPPHTQTGSASGSPTPTALRRQLRVPVPLAAGSTCTERRPLLHLFPRCLLLPQPPHEEWRGPTGKRGWDSPLEALGPGRVGRHGPGPASSSPPPQTRRETPGTPGHPGPESTLGLPALPVPRPGLDRSGKGEPGLGPVGSERAASLCP